MFPWRETRMAGNLTRVKMRSKTRLLSWGKLRPLDQKSSPERLVYACWQVSFLNRGEYCRLRGKGSDLSTNWARPRTQSTCKFCVKRWMRDTNVPADRTARLYHPVRIWKPGYLTGVARKITPFLEYLFKFWNFSQILTQSSRPIVAGGCNWPPLLIALHYTSGEKNK